VFDNNCCSAAIRAAFSRLNRSTVRRTSIPFLYCQINSANNGGPIAKTISSVRRRYRIYVKVLVNGWFKFGSRAGNAGRRGRRLWSLMTRRLTGSSRSSIYSGSSRESIPGTSP